MNLTPPPRPWGRGRSTGPEAAVNRPYRRRSGSGALVSGPGTRPTARSPPPVVALGHCPVRALADDLAGAARGHVGRVHGHLVQPGVRAHLDCGEPVLRE